MNYNQLDPLYKKIMLGFSKKYSLYSDGCYVFSLAHVLGIDPVDCNERMKAVNGFMADSTGDKCLMDHTKIAVAFPDRISEVVKYTTYDNVACLDAIKNYSHCIVQVDYDGSPSTVFDTHFVDFIGNKTLFDSLGGKEKPTSTYPLLKGLRVIKLIPLVVEDNMTDDQKNILKFLADNNANEGKVREAFGALADIPKLTKQIDDLTTAQGNLNNQITDLTQKVATIQKSADDWQTQLTTANKTGQKLSADLAYYQPYKALYEKALTDQVNKYTGWQLIRLGVNKLLLTVKK